MSFGITVQGGTGAGRKRPLRDKPRSWRCCGHTNAGYLARCPRCRRRRP